MNEQSFFGPILKYIGSIQCLVAGLILTILPISLLYGEYYQAVFLVCLSAIIFLVG